LFKTVVATRNAISQFEKLFGGEEYMEPFTRVFHDRKPQYRMFLAILSLSALLRVDPSARLDDAAKEMERMRSFVQRAKLMLENDPKAFVRTYARAFQTFAAEARANSGEDTKVKQYLASLLRRGFRTLYSTLVMMIDTDKMIAKL
jgi:hypothetical protein